jgi:cytochrome P450
MTLSRGTDLAVAKDALHRLLGGLTDPYPDYHLLRAVAPVYISEFGACFLTRYADCQQVLTSAVRCAGPYLVRRQPAGLAVPLRDPLPLSGDAEP